MKNVIIGKNWILNLDFDELFEELDKSSDKKFDPKKLSNLISPLNNILNKIEKNLDIRNVDYTKKKFNLFY